MEDETVLVVKGVVVVTVVPTVDVLRVVKVGVVELTLGMEEEGLDVDRVLVVTLVLD